MKGLPMFKKVLVAIALTIFIATVVLPIVWIFVGSFKSSQEIFESPWSLPKVLQWKNFSKAWTEASIGRYALNSLVVTFFSLVILIPISSMAAYIFAKFPFKGSKFLFGTFLGGMMFPNFLVIVPLFLLLNNLHMLDSRLGLVAVYVAYSLSFTIFVLTGFFHAIPNELGEAAMMDGCSLGRTFWKVMLPLAKPGLIVVAIFDGIGLWNEYGLALVLMQSEENKTLPLGIANLAMNQQYQADWGALFAGLVIVMFPVLIVYWIFRDKIHETMLAGAVKG